MGRLILNYMDTIIISLLEHVQKVLVYAEMVDREVRARGLQNEQWFLDFQDKLNELSVK